MSRDEHDDTSTSENRLVIAPKRRRAWRGTLKEQALASAMQKWATGVPTYSVPEAAALLSISSEYLYRLIQRGGFPAVRMCLSGSHGRYVVSAEAVERLLDKATSATASVDVTDWTASYAAASRTAKEA